MGDEERVRVVRGENDVFLERGMDGLVEVLGGFDDLLDKVNNSFTSGADCHA